MARIFDRILSSFSGLNSVALDPDARLAAVCFNDRELHVYHILKGARHPERLQAADTTVDSEDEVVYLDEYRFLRLAQDRYGRPANAEIRYRHSRIAFLNQETILIAREIEQVGGGSFTSEEEPATISLAAIRVGTGEVIAEYTAADYGPIVAAPILLSPNHVLIAAAETVVCVDVTTFRECYRIPSNGEQVAYNGLAFDPLRQTLHVLWAEFESSFLETYALEPDRTTFNKLQRRPVDLDGLEGNSLCLSPDGNEIAVWSSVMNEVIERRSRKDCSYSGETVRLGRLDLFSEGGHRIIEVQSPFERYSWRTREFTVSSIYPSDQGGTVNEVGIRYGVLDHYVSKPFYLDEQTVVINSPGGLLIGVDTVTGKSEELEDAWSPIQDLCVHAQRKLLLIGKRGSGNVPIAVNLLGFDGAHEGG